MKREAGGHKGDQFNLNLTEVPELAAEHINPHPLQRLDFRERDVGRGPANWFLDPRDISDDS